MAKSKNIVPEVLEVEAEEVPVSAALQKTIDSEVKRFDPFESRVNELKEKYSGLVIVDINDREGYEEVRIAIGELRGVRTGTEKDKKNIKKPFLDACASIEAKSKWIIEEVKKIEDPLQKRKDEIDAEKEKITVEKKRKQEAAFLSRSVELTKMGAAFDGTSFTLEDVSYEAILLKEADEDVYATMFAKYKAIFDRHEAARIEQERLAAEAANNARLERIELEKFRAEQEARAAELKAEADRIAAQKEANEREERNRKAHEEEKLWRGRLNELNDVGWNGQEAFAKYDDSVVVASYTELLTLDPKAWQEVRDGHNTKNAEFLAAKKRTEEEAERKKEEERQAEIDRLKTEAEAKQAEAVAHALAMQAEEQVLRQKREEAERQRIESEKAELLAQGTDKNKWGHVVGQLKSIEWPEFSSGQFRKKAKELKAIIDAA
jgi:hypothetical protein